MQTCDQLARRAQQCCNNPSSCMTGSQGQQGPAPGQGLNEYCQQMRAAGAMNGQANSSASGVCYSAYNNCVQSCEGMAGGYSGQPAQMMMDAANTCRGYQSKVSQLANQGLNSQISGSSGDICSNVSQAQPQNMSGNQADPTNSNNNMNPSSTDTTNCQANPNTPACQAAAAAQQKQMTGEAAFAVAGEAAPKKGNYNVPEPDMSNPPFGGAGGADSPPGGGMKNGTIANNSGGGIPGAGGGGSPASLNGGGRGGGASPGSPGYTTDVLQGFQGGEGYSSPSGSGPTGSDGGRGYGMMPNSRAPAGTDPNGVALSRFLPGGDRDPLRRKIGGYDIYSGQINGKFVNIWNRISDRMQEKCRLGELLGCG